MPNRHILMRAALRAAAASLVLGVALLLVSTAGRVGETPAQASAAVEVAQSSAPALASGSAPELVAAEASATGQRTFASLDQGTQQGILSAMRLASGVIESSDALLFNNPGQQLQAAIGRSGTQVLGQSGTRVELGGAALGRRETVVPLSEGVPTGKGTSVIELSRRAGDVFVTEWWKNPAGGVEQGFTVHSRPDGTGALAVSQTVQSTLRMSVTADGRGVHFMDGEQIRLQFDGLRAWDATGRDLPARMLVSGATLTMSVDDTDAHYPVTIDPIWAQQAFLKAPNPDAYDYFGRSVAISGDTIVVGAFGEASNATGVTNGTTADADNSKPDAGAAYVFLVAADRTSPSTPSLSATPRTAAALSGTGVPLSLSWTAAADGGSGVAGYEIERSVNGGSWAAVGAYSVRSAAVIAASSGTVRYRVRAVDGAANWGGWAYTPTLSPRLVQQSSSAGRYGGTWYSTSSTAYSGGSAKYANVAGRSATYTFTGRSIAFVTTKAPTRGKVRIYVNGVYVATVDLYRSSTQYRVLVWQKTWSTSGTRTIKLVVVGTAGRPRIDLDAFVVVK